MWIEELCAAKFVCFNITKEGNSSCDDSKERRKCQARNDHPERTAQVGVIQTPKTEEKQAASVKKEEAVKVIMGI